MAQERTRSNVTYHAPTKDELGEGRLLFAGVGINHYERSDLWKKLDNAVNDVTAVKTALEKFDFISPPGYVLSDPATTTTEGIWSLVDMLEQQLEPDDSLVFFFAGHGTEVVEIVGGDTVGRTGYLVPSDVKGTVKEVRRQYIAIKDLLQRLANIDVRHVFVILDSCKSGLSLAPLTKSDRGDGTGAAAKELMSLHSRRVMSSAMGDQNASDVGQVSPKNSRFTGWLVAALERAQRGEEPALVGDDGMITSSDLFTFVRDRVFAESNNQQMPDFGRFDNDKSGELVLTLERDPFGAPFTRAVDAFNRGDFGAVPEAVEEALRVRRDGFGADFLRYLLACIPGREDHGRILASLRAMSARIQAGEAIPAESGLSKGSLIVQLSRAETICQKTACTVPRDGR